MKALPLLVLLAWSAAVSAAVPVTTQPLGELLLVAEHNVPATVLAQNAPELAAELNARVVALPARVGDRVAAGDLLARLDCRLFESQLAAARAALSELQARRRFAAAQLERARDLKQKRSISDEVVEQRQSELASLSAQITVQQQAIVQDELRVERCEIRAPFAAVVSARLADVGGLASPGTPLVHLVQLDQLEVSAELREAEADELSQLTAAWFEYLGERHPLTLRRLVPVVDERTRTREARLEFSGAAAPPGAAGRLVWQRAQRLIPAALLVRRGDRLGLFSVNAGRARFHPLPGAVEGRPAVVDLPPDTAIVVDGRQGLSDGEPVQVPNRAAAD
jgi:RND family efflux transporter MFP subunit